MTTISYTNCHGESIGGRLVTYRALSRWERHRKRKWDAAIVAKLLPRFEPFTNGAGKRRYFVADCWPVSRERLPDDRRFASHEAAWRAANTLNRAHGHPEIPEPLCGWDYLRRIAA